MPSKHPSSFHSGSNLFTPIAFERNSGRIAALAIGERGVARALRELSPAAPHVEAPVWSVGSRRGALLSEIVRKTYDNVNILCHLATIGRS